MTYEPFNGTGMKVTINAVGGSPNSNEVSVVAGAGGGGATNLALAFATTHDLDTHARLLALPPLTFDAFAGNFFPALISGAALVFHPSPAELTGRTLLQFAEKHGVTMVDAPAALLKGWMDDLAPLGDGGVRGLRLRGLGLGLCAALRDERSKLFRQIRTVEQHVKAFRDAGAKIEIGGNLNSNFSNNEFSGPIEPETRNQIPDTRNLFFEPTVISGATNDMLPMREETFGPALPNTPATINVNVPVILGELDINNTNALQFTGAGLLRILAVEGSRTALKSKVA